MVAHVSIPTIWETETGGLPLELHNKPVCLKKTKQEKKNHHLTCCWLWMTWSTVSVERLSLGGVPTWKKIRERCAWVCACSDTGGQRWASDLLTLVTDSCECAPVSEPCPVMVQYCPSAPTWRFCWYTEGVRSHFMPSSFSVLSALLWPWSRAAS